MVRAGYYYGKIVSDHPLSSYADESRKRLEELNLPIPEVNPEAMARAQAEKEQHEKNSLMGRATSLIQQETGCLQCQKIESATSRLGAGAH